MPSLPGLSAASAFCRANSPPPTAAAPIFSSCRRLVRFEFFMDTSSLVRLSRIPERGFVTWIFCVNILGVDAFGEDQPNPGSIHFFPALFSAVDISIGITSEFVVRRIIEVRHHPDFRPFWNLDRLFEVVRHLPIKVIARLDQYSFNLPV